MDNSRMHLSTGVIKLWEDNVVFSRLMDAGKLLAAYISELDPKSEDYMHISIGIYLVDF